MTSRPPGREQREPMERLVRLAAVLHHAGERGVLGSELIRIAGFAGGADPGSQLAREFRHMRTVGWSIENIAEPGEPARFRMTSVDNRLRLRLTPAQQAALRRAVLLADRADLVRRLALVEGEEAAAAPAIVPVADPDPGLDVVLRAVRHRALLRFRYAGTDRVVHPASLRAVDGTWYLRGREEGGDIIKTFVVARMGDPVSDVPGSATTPAPVRHVGLDPMGWQVDPPVEVTLRTAERFVPDVVAWLGEPAARSGPERAEGAVDLTYRVSHRAALRRRLVELGTRVRIVSPDSIRDELIAELAEMAGE